MDERAPGKAAVYCLILGFSRRETERKHLFGYAEVDGEPHESPTKNINSYLVDSTDVLIARRDTPLCKGPKIGIGNKPIDGGYYLFTPEEKAEFIAREPLAGKWFKRWIDSDEFIKGYARWCLWLGNCPPEELKKMPEAMQRVEAVRNFRLASRSAPTRKIVATPTRFEVEDILKSSYLVIPEATSFKSFPMRLCTISACCLPTCTWFGLVTRADA